MQNFGEWLNSRTCESSMLGVGGATDPWKEDCHGSNPASFVK